MKKILVVGQVPKEYGGGYTTGVANVIIAITAKLKELSEVDVYATNHKANTKILFPDVRLFGNDRKTLLRKLFYFVVFHPLKALVELYTYRFKYGAPPIRLICYRMQIDSLCYKKDYDVINFHGMLFSPLIKFLKYNGKYSFTFHGLTMDDHYSKKANKKRGIDIEKLYLEGAKNIKNPIYLNQKMRELANDRLKIDNADSELISNGVDVRKFKFDQNARKKIRSQFQVADSDLVILSVGALTKLKNHIGFIEFLERVDFNGEYWIIGKREAEETYNRITSLKKEITCFQIKIIDYVPNSELYEFYSAADIYSQPSTAEGQPLSILEALCCGLPVVANNAIEGILDFKSEYVEYLDLLNDYTDFKIYNIDGDTRETIARKFKKDLGWKKVAKKYYEYFNRITNA